MLQQAAEVLLQTRQCWPLQGFPCILLKLQPAWG